MSDLSQSGSLRIRVYSSLGLIPVSDALVSIFLSSTPTESLGVFRTDISGLTEEISLPAPSADLSATPSEIRPYEEYNIKVTAEGYEPVLIIGSQLLPGELSLQSVQMNPLEITDNKEQVITIPPHVLFGDYPAKIPEAEVKPIEETGEIVLSRVVIPEYIIVHDGSPSDTTAPDYWVRYTDYIKNVASCEIYSTWPEATIYANILAIMSFTLNRVYTEW